MLGDVEYGDLSTTTINNYKTTAKNIPFGIFSTQATIIKKLKSNYENPNTRATYLNMIIMIRRYKSYDIDQLVKYRNRMKVEIKDLRNEKLLISKNELPTMEYLESQLKHLVGIKYIINYLFLTYGFRNGDINLKYVKEVPDEKTENYIYFVNKKLKLSINRYKTGKVYGEKIYVIDNKEFIKQFNKLDLTDGDYLIQNSNNKKYSISNFNDLVLKLSIDQLGEARIFKIIIRDLLEKKNYDGIDKYSISRGTSMSTIMKSYNILKS